MPTATSTVSGRRDGRLVSVRNSGDFRREGLSRSFDFDHPYGEARAYLASLLSVLGESLVPEAVGEPRGKRYACGLLLEERIRENHCRRDDEK
jgi:hypothetical protein